MDVERRPAADAQEIGGHDLAVGDEDEAVGIEADELVAGLGGTQPGRRQDVEAPLAGGDGDRRGPQLEPPPGGAIRLADDEHLVGDIRHSREQRDTEWPGPEERDAPDALDAH